MTCQNKSKTKLKWSAKQTYTLRIEFTPLAARLVLNGAPLEPVVGGLARAAVALTDWRRRRAPATMRSRSPRRVSTDAAPPPRLPADSRR